MLDSLLSAILRKFGDDSSIAQLTTQGSELILSNPAVQAGLAASTIVLLGILVRRRTKKRAAAKQTALRLIELEKETMSPSAAMEVLRQAVLCYYPHNHVATLTGKAWFDFLDSQSDQPVFANHHANWEQALQTRRQQDDKEARQELVEQCASWLNHSLPPKRKFRR